MKLLWYAICTLWIVLIFKKEGPRFYKGIISLFFNFAGHGRNTSEASGGRQCQGQELADPPPHCRGQQRCPLCWVSHSSTDQRQRLGPGGQDQLTARLVQWSQRGRLSSNSVSISYGQVDFLYQFLCMFFFFNSQMDICILWHIPIVNAQDTIVYKSSENKVLDAFRSWRI